MNAIESLTKWIVPIGALVTGVQYSMYNVEGGHKAILFDRIRGVLPDPIQEGTHFLIPWLQRAIIMDVRTKPRNISTTTGSKDMQMVSLTLRVLHRPDQSLISTIYQNLGLDYDERVLPSIGNEVLKSIVAQFDAGELITQRDQVSHRIREDLVKRAGEFNILLEDVSITHLMFGKEFTNAVEQKQIAQQEAERAKFIVEKAEQEKLAAIIHAEGDATAADLISKALTKAGVGLVELRRIEASKEIAKTLADSKNVSYLPGGKGNTLARRLLESVVTMRISSKSREHAKEMGSKVPAKPLFFLKPTSSYLGSGGVILVPKGTVVEHEVELGVIIGQDSSRANIVNKKNAMDYVSGYCVGIDVTSRILQREAISKGEPWTESKGRDTFAPVSNFVPKEDILDPKQTSIWLKVNGSFRQNGNVSDMIFDIPSLIAHVSSIMTLNRGDLILTGTPAGVGPLVDGDVVEAGLVFNGKRLASLACSVKEE